MKVLIDKDAFGELILDLISTQEYKQYTDIMLTTDKKAFESDEANKKAIEEEKALLSELCETQKEFKLIADEISVYNIYKEEL